MSHKVGHTVSYSSGSGWRDGIAVLGGDETACFEYDSLGRLKHVYKISKDGIVFLAALYSVTCLGLIMAIDVE